MFLKEVSYAHEASIYLIKNTVKTTVKYYYNLKCVFYFNTFKNYIYLCDANAEFSASLLQSSVSHDPSEIILICWFGA